VCLADRHMAGPKKRGRTVDVPESWIRKVEEYWGRSGKSLEQLGEALAPLLGEARPVSYSRVYQYIREGKTSAEMTRAFASLMGVPPPVLGVDDPELVAWFEVGACLRDQSADRFREELAALQELVATLATFRRNRRH
jgi:hypothetical protein